MVAVRMNYIPSEFLNPAVPEREASEVGAIRGPAIIRRLPIEAFEVRNGLLSLTTDALPLPLSIKGQASMTFGTETVAAIDYFRRVIEHGDMIDAVVLPQSGDTFPMRSFWIHIEYVGKPLRARSYSKKDDGLFAMRTKAGEKGERVVTKLLRDRFGHRFPEAMCVSPGHFEIRYEGKKIRKPDRRCQVCGLTFEIKKRNRDEHLRVSHSDTRPFESENSPDGWHAFVFPDMKPRFVPNWAIALAIAERRFVAGKDMYDKWADVDSLAPCDPPACNA